MRVTCSVVIVLLQEVHEFIKRNFKFLNTDTVEHSDGIQKCIRVRLGSGPRGGRARNRRGMNSSGWRDDKPFDSRGSTSWPYHLGKFLRCCHFFLSYASMTC
jgi:tRNA pseudouridine13 synthase